MLLLLRWPAEAALLIYYTICYNINVIRLQDNVLYELYSNTFFRLVVKLTHKVILSKEYLNKFYMNGLSDVAFRVLNLGLGQG